MFNLQLPNGSSTTQVTGRVYSLVDPDGVTRYIGSTEHELSKRMQLHCLKLEHDCTASPLLRYVSQRGGFEGWTIRQVVAITYDPAVRPDALRDAETSAITALRRAGHPLLNKNLPKCQSADRREYMRQWRQRNPGYMAREGREHRERRRVAALAAKAEQLALELAMQPEEVETQ